MVLGKFNIGDIVVSMKSVTGGRQIGDLFKIQPNSTEKMLYTDRLAICSSEPESWEIATDEEIDLYNKGIVEKIFIDNRMLFDKTFAFRFKHFVECLETSDSYGHMVKESMLSYATRLLNRQIITATDKDEIEYLKSKGLIKTPEYNCKCDGCSIMYDEQNISYVFGEFNLCDDCKNNDKLIFQ